MPSSLSKSLSIAALALAAGGASAAAITPTSTSFGPLLDATFGGSGIPNTAVAVSTAASGVTLGLTAHQRFDSPAVTNDGAGTFRALPGIDTHSPSPADPYALWNFGFYIGGTASTGYNYSLLYDFDPGVGTDESEHGRLILGSSSGEDSWNLGMNFLASTAFPAAITPPSFAAFDPSASGEYTFALLAFDQAGTEVARSAIRVLVNDVPEPASLALVGVALLGLAGVRRRKA